MLRRALMTVPDADEALTPADIAAHGPLYDNVSFHNVPFVWDPAHTDYGAQTGALTRSEVTGYAPGVFKYIDRSGRPLFSVLAILIFGALAYINLDAKGDVIFDWLLALSGLAALFTWGSICLAHIRFRKAWAYHGHTLDEIPFKATGGVYGSWLGIFIIVLVLLSQVCLPSN